MPPNPDSKLDLDYLIDKAIERARAELPAISPWLSVPEAATRLKFKSPVALAKLCVLGPPHGPKSSGTGKRRRIRVDHLDAWQESLPHTGGDDE